MIGFTIEGNQMRLWFASRSEVVASWPFQFLTVSLGFAVS